MRSLLAVLSITLLSTVAVAEDHYNVELSGGTNASIDFGTSSPSTTTIRANADVALPVVEPMLDFLFITEFGSFSSAETLSGTSEYSLALLGGFQVNFGDPNPRNSFLLAGTAGIDMEHASGSTSTKFEFLFRGGKRFMLSNSVSYVPIVEFFKIADISGHFSIIPLQFSLFL
jgi:hypothetical protein